MRLAAKSDEREMELEPTSLSAVPGWALPALLLPRHIPQPRAGLGAERAEALRESPGGRTRRSSI